MAAQNVPGDDTERDAAFVVIPADECRTLLATRQLGRIGLAGGPFPLILPVNYVLDGDAVVIRTDSPKITAAADHTRVAFEVDDVDERTRSGWSVLVQGWGQDLTDAAGSAFEQLRRRSIGPWAPGEKAHWLAVEIRHISGRRIRPPG